MLFYTFICAKLIFLKDLGIIPALIIHKRMITATKQDTARSLSKQQLKHQHRNNNAGLTNNHNHNT